MRTPRGGTGVGWRNAIQIPAFAGMTAGRGLAGGAREWRRGAGWWGGAGWRRGARVGGGDAGWRGGAGMAVGTRVGGGIGALDSSAALGMSEGGRCMTDGGGGSRSNIDRTGRRGDTEFRGHARRGASGALYSQSALARLNSPLRAVIQMTRSAHAVLMFGSRATKASEPRQVRKEATIRNVLRAPRGRLG